MKGITLSSIREAPASAEPSAGLLKCMKENQPEKTEATPSSMAQSAQAAAELNARLSLGLAAKRKAESWEEFEDRVIQMFRDKGLFKNDRPS